MVQSGDSASNGQPFPKFAFVKIHASLLPQTTLVIIRFEIYPHLCLSRCGKVIPELVIFPRRIIVIVEKAGSRHLKCGELIWFVTAGGRDLLGPPCRGR